MPAGASWSRYLSFFTAAMISMFAGSQTVHHYYKPLQDIDMYVNKEIEKQHLSITAEEVLHSKQTN